MKNRSRGVTQPGGGCVDCADAHWVRPELVAEGKARVRGPRR